MKVDSSGSVRTGTVRRKDKTREGAAGDFASHVSGAGNSGAPGVSGTANLSSVESLLALQQAPDATADQRSPDHQRADDLLNRLDRIRLGILNGNVDKGELEALVARLEERQRDAGDPRLAAIIDEIELRAKVELAKLSVI